jgi:hypothetical protein
MITLQLEISTVQTGGNEFGVSVRITGGPLDVKNTPEAEGATLIGVGMAINEYMRARGASNFNCLKGLLDV